MSWSCRRLVDFVIFSILVDDRVRIAIDLFCAQGRRIAIIGYLGTMYARGVGEMWHFSRETASRSYIICYINIKCMYVYVYL